MKNIGKPCAGKPHARFDEGGQVTACFLLYPIIRYYSESFRVFKAPPDTFANKCQENLQFKSASTSCRS